MSQSTSRQNKKFTHIYCIAAETLNQPSKPIKATASAFPAKRSASGGKVLLDGQFDTSIKWQLWPQCACDVSSTELKGGKNCSGVTLLRMFKDCGIHACPHTSTKMPHSVKRFRKTLDVSMKPCGWFVIYTDTELLTNNQMGLDVFQSSQGCLFPPAHYYTDLFDQDFISQLWVISVGKKLTIKSKANWHSLQRSRIYLTLVRWSCFVWWQYFWWSLVGPEHYSAFK